MKNHPVTQFYTDLINQNKGPYYITNPYNGMSFLGFEPCSDGKDVSSKTFHTWQAMTTRDSQGSTWMSQEFI